MLMGNRPGAGVDGGAGNIWRNESCVFILWLPESQKQSWNFVVPALSEPPSHFHRWLWFRVKMLHPPEGKRPGKCAPAAHADAKVYAAAGENENVEKTVLKHQLGCKIEWYDYCATPRLELSFTSCHLGSPSCLSISFLEPCPSWPLDIGIVFPAHNEFASYLSFDKTDRGAEMCHLPRAWGAVGRGKGEAHASSPLL